MKLILTLCALTVCSAFSLQAQAPGGGKGGQHMSAEERFKKLDTNGDGFLSKEEFLAGPFGQKNPDMAAKRYAEMDKKARRHGLSALKPPSPKAVQKRRWCCPCSTPRPLSGPSRTGRRVAKAKICVFLNVAGTADESCPPFYFGERSHHRSTTDTLCPSASEYATRVSSSTTQANGIFPKISKKHWPREPSHSHGSRIWRVRRLSCPLPWFIATGARSKAR